MGKAVSNDRYKSSKTGFVSLERLDSILNVEQGELERVYVKGSDPDFPANATRSLFLVTLFRQASRRWTRMGWTPIPTKASGPWHTIKLHVRLLAPTLFNKAKLWEF